MTRWLLDCDGVLWQGGTVLPGGRKGLRQLVQSGAEVAYFTNNSSRPIGEIVGRIAQMGVRVAPSDVLTSPQAAAQLVEPGERVLVLGGRGAVEALASRGVKIVEGAEPTPGSGPGRIDAVVVALDLDLSYGRLAGAVSAVLGGARLVAMNADPVYPGEGGRLLPGTGALAAAVEAATGVAPIFAGKPHGPAIALVRARLGGVDVVVGDQPSSDGALACALGARFGLVHSSLPASTEARWPVHGEGQDLDAVVSALLGTAATRP